MLAAFVVAVVLVAVVAVVTVLARCSSFEPPSGSTKSKLRFHPRARQILTDDDYETTAMLDSPSLVSASPARPPAAVSSLRKLQRYTQPGLSLITCLPGGRGTKLWGWRTVVMVTEHTPRYPLISESVMLLATPLLREGAYATRTEISRDILLSPKIHKDELSGG